MKKIKVLRAVIASKLQIFRKSYQWVVVVLFNDEQIVHTSLGSHDVRFPHCKSIDDFVLLGRTFDQGKNLTWWGPIKRIFRFSGSYFNKRCHTSFLKHSDLPNRINDYYLYLNKGFWTNWLYLSLKQFILEKKNLNQLCTYSFFQANLCADWR